MTRFETMSREAGLMEAGRIEPDPGALDLEGVLGPPGLEPAPVAAPQRSLRLVRRTSLAMLTGVSRREVLAWAAVLVPAYVLLAWWLADDANLYVGDAVSRVASASFAVDSRDPHLSAIGFIFPPLITLLEVPLVSLRGLWDPLVSQAMAGAIVSAVFMAGAAIEVMRIVRVQTGRRALSRLAALAFALNPLILFYAANGMSEAAYVYLVLRGCRSLMGWIRTDDVGGLVAGGGAFALAYLVRYEAVVIAAGGAAIVVGVNVLRRRAAPRRALVNQIVIDVMTLLLPVILAFAGWTIASWLLTGEPFAQFTSTYGNATIIEQASGGGEGRGGLSAFVHPLVSTLLLCPVLPFAVAWALRTMRRRNDLPVIGLAIPAGLGLAFSIYSTGKGTTFEFLRYFILAVPLGVIAGALLHRRVGTVLCALSLTVPLATTWLVMDDPARGVQEHYVGAALFPSTATDDERRMLRQFDNERRLADALDRLDLPDGSVLADALFAFPVVLASEHPKQFVITTDRDFAQALDRPAESGVRYLLTVPDEERGRSDAVNRRYPGIYETGGRIGTLVLQAESDGPDPWFRLYRVR